MGGKSDQARQQASAEKRRRAALRRRREILDALMKILRGGA
jgi:hypothetical protein